MELEHQSRTINKSGTQQNAAVNLDQFRNTEVGKGYQAKHVIRQKEKGTASPTSGSALVVEDRTRPKGNVDTRSARDRKDELASSQTEQPIHDTLLLSYLQCTGLREFRKELEKV